MQVADLEQVLQIEHQSFSMPWSNHLFRSELKSATSHLLAARLVADPDTIAGYIGYRVVVDEMHIVIVAVEPRWRRRGVAKQMLNQAIEHAIGNACTKATLEVRVSNVEAQQLYYQQRFTPMGTRPKYYMRPTEDALILWRDPL